MTAAPKDGAEAFARQLALNKACPNTPEWDAAHRIADRMEACPNNPRHGGAGYDVRRFWGFDVDDTDGARRRQEAGLATPQQRDARGAR